MTTDHMTRSMPRAMRHLYRSGLPAAAANWHNCTAYVQSFRGHRPDSHEVSRVPETRARVRHTDDPLTVPLVRRVRLRPSPLILADSLREMLAGMACPVARAIIRAEGSAYDCATKLPGNYYAWRETAGKVSYCPRGKTQQYTDGGRWARAGRQDTTPARFARAVLPARVLRELGDAALSTFAQRFAAAEEAQRLIFRVLDSAEEITEAYDRVRGTGSCMEGDPVGPWYAAAGASCVVCLRGGDWVARAILWTLENGVEFMDRVYTRHEEVREAMYSHAAEQGWHRKARQSGSEFSLVLRPDGTEYRAAMVVQTPRSMLPHLGGYVPYHDTFAYLSGCGRELHNCDGDEKTEGWELRHTDGTVLECEDEHEGQAQTHSGDWIDEEDARTTVDGDTYHCDDVTYCDEDGEYYPDEDDRIIYCDTRGETILTENARRVTVNGHPYVVHVDDIEEL